MKYVISQAVSKIRDEVKEFALKVYVLSSFIQTKGTITRVLKQALIALILNEYVQFTK